MKMRTIRECEQQGIDLVTKKQSLDDRLSILHSMDKGGGDYVLSLTVQWMILRSLRYT